MGTLRFTRGFHPPTMASVGGGRRHQRTHYVHVSAVVPRVDPVDVASAGGTRKGNWVLKILRVNSLWAKERETEKEVGRAEEEGEDDTCPGCPDGCHVVDGEREEEEKVEVFDRSRFSELLRRVSMAELEVYAKMSYLSVLAYNIPNIKPISLLKQYGLRFVTSSLEKKAPSSDPEKEQLPQKNTKRDKQSRKQVENGYRLSPAAAYDTVASAASFLQSQTRSILPFRSPSGDQNQSELCNVPDEVQCGISSSDMASFIATTNSITAVVAGKEEMKEAVAKDLNSASSCPCEWFICDDDESSTRYFVVQGSESMASWQANLLFEPIQFEGMDVLVHRGIYEAAKGIYQQMLPEVRAHLESKGNSATLRFTGHSLGGSLCLLVNLMLLIRGEVPTSALLPVITFGSPTIMCGGDYLLRKLGLPESHVQAITMHRDIVPRAFSCNYPDHVAKILRAVNGNFRKHPCLNNQKLLYAPMGKLLILQPDEKFSPHHDFLPPGSGLYLLVHSSRDPDNSTRRIFKSARTAFLNTPHPLEILSERSAYGSSGTVNRDHHMRSYMRSVLGVFRHELKLIRKVRREHRRLLWFPLVVEGRHTLITSSVERKFSFVGVLNGGIKETLKRFGKKLGNVNMFIVLLFPARLLLMGTLSLSRVVIGN